MTTTESTTAPTTEAVPPLTVERQNRVLEVALDYAEAVQAYRKVLNLGPDPDAEVVARASKMAEQRQLLLELTLSSDHLLYEAVAHRDDLLGRVRDLTGDRDRLQNATDAVTEEREELLRRFNVSSRAAARAQSELAAFKEQVVEVADQYADEHGWCNVIDKALEELGLERAPKEYRAKLTITLDVYGTLANGRRDLPIERAIRDSIAFDDDHASGSVEDFEFEVDDVQEND